MNRIGLMVVGVVLAMGVKDPPVTIYEGASGTGF